MCGDLYNGACLVRAFGARGRRALVAVLLVAALLVIATYVGLTTRDLGFDKQPVATLFFVQPVTEVPPADRFAAGAMVFAELLDRASAVPGVSEAAIMVGNSLLDLNEVRESLEVPGRSTLGGEDMLVRRHVSTGYFRTLGIGLVRGRLFASSDGPGSPRVMLINETAERRFFPGRDPLGLTATYRGVPRTIIGVVRDVHARGPEAETTADMYFPLLQDDTVWPL